MYMLYFHTSLFTWSSHMKTEYTIEDYESIERQWTDAFARRRGWEDRFLTEPIELIAQFLEHVPGPFMLDAGCGWARYVNLFVENSMEYVGLDISSEMLRVAKASNPGLRFLQGTIRKMPFSDDCFQGVWSCCALSSFPKKYISSVLAEHWRVLRPDGVMLIVMPDIHSSNEGMVDPEDGVPSLFQSHYLRHEFVEYVRATEFEILDVTSYLHEHGAMSILVRK